MILSASRIQSNKYARTYATVYGMQMYARDALLYIKHVYPVGSIYIIVYNEFFVAGRSMELRWVRTC